jgi:hypothetical protein
MVINKEINDRNRYVFPDLIIVAIFNSPNVPENIPKQLVMFSVEAFSVWQRSVKIRILIRNQLLMSSWTISRSMVRTSSQHRNHEYNQLHPGSHHFFEGQNWTISRNG